MVSAVAQFSDPASASENLQGFVAAMILCPIPLMGTGLASLVGGLLIARSVQKTKAETVFSEDSEVPRLEKAMSNRTRVLDYELNPPDFDFVRGLAEAMGMPLPDCMALLTRPLESLPGDHTPTQIKDGSIVTLNLRRKLGRLPRIPKLENLGSLRALNCSLHYD